MSTPQSELLHALVRNFRKMESLLCVAIYMHLMLSCCYGFSFLAGPAISSPAENIINAFVLFLVRAVPLNDTEYHFFL